MKFDLKLEQKVLHSEGNDLLVTYKCLTVDREEFINQFEKDDTSLYNTLREVVYMYHSASGYITQMSDTAMNGIYHTFIEHQAYIGVSFLMEEQEILSSESDFDRKKSVNIDLLYLK